MSVFAKGGIMTIYKSNGFISNGWLALIFITLGLSLSIPVRADELSLADKPLFTSAGYLPNILVIIDNSNSMDEAASGLAVGSDSPESKSEIARGVIKELITSYNGKINLGLMAYQQSGVVSQKLHNSFYDVSFDPANYNPDYIGDRDSITKKYSTPNISNPGFDIYYNIGLPFYFPADSGSAYCYSKIISCCNKSALAKGTKGLTFLSQIP